MIPTGRSRLGFRTSPATTAACSNPMYANSASSNPLLRPAESGVAPGALKANPPSHSAARASTMSGTPLETVSKLFKRAPYFTPRKLNATRTAMNTVIDRNDAARLSGDCRPETPGVVEHHHGDRAECRQAREVHEPADDETGSRSERLFRVVHRSAGNVVAARDLDEAKSHQRHEDESDEEHDEAQSSGSHDERGRERENSGADHVVEDERDYVYASKASVKPRRFDGIGGDTTRSGYRFALPASRCSSSGNQLGTTIS